MAGADDVVSAIAGKQPGDTVEIEYYRGDDKRTVEVKLGERPEQLESATGAAAAAQRRLVRSAALGLRPLRA